MIQRPFHRCDCGQDCPVVRETAYEFGWRCPCGRAGVADPKGWGSVRRRESQRANAEKRWGTRHLSPAIEQALDEQIVLLGKRGLLAREIRERLGVKMWRVYKLIGRRPRKGRTRGPYRTRSIHTSVWPFSLSSKESALTAQINLAVRKNIPEDLRADICQELALLVLSGEIVEHQLKTKAVELARSARSKYSDGKPVLSLDYPFTSHGHSAIKDLI